MNLGVFSDTLYIDSSFSNGTYGFYSSDSSGIFNLGTNMEFYFKVESFNAQVHFSSIYSDPNNYIDAFISGGKGVRWSTNKPSFLSNWCEGDSNTIGLSKDSTLLTVDILHGDANCISTYQKLLRDTTTASFSDTIVYFDTVPVLDTIPYAVMDTLIIDVSLLNTSSPVGHFEIMVYPNPTRDVLYIETPTNYINKGYLVEIFNPTGQSVYGNFINQQKLQVNLNSFGASGSYNLLIKNALGNIINSKTILLN